MIRQPGNFAKQPRKSASRSRSASFTSLLAAGKTTQYAAGQMIFSQGDDCIEVHYIQQGLVKLTLVSPRGKSAVLGILGHGDFCGERCLAEETTYLTSAMALVPCSIVKISSKAMTRSLEQQPSLAKEFIHSLLLHNHRIEENLVDHFFQSSEKRLARILLRLRQYGEHNGERYVLPRISQDTLAEMVGTTRSRVNYFMNKFRKLGFVRYNGELEVRETLPPALQD